ncbi:rRNA pseudouridine synthase [candidate division WOR-3 bacterium]|nr:rRNA pseudouridine synthase [candidate division WOR-3 bacterium]
MHKFLAGWGIGSRRKIEEWIKEGRILKNGKRAKVGDRLGAEDEIFVLDRIGTRLYRATLRGVFDERNKCWLKPGFEYWIVNKPRGTLSSTRDPHHSRMVTHLVHSSQGLFPVGRLDKESEGLMILTSDGELCNKLTHPRFEVHKRYEVTLDWPPDHATLVAIEKGGVVLEDGPTLPIDVRTVSPRRLELTMREGRKREIRRLFAHFGHRVVRLRRVAFGPLTLKDIPPGSSRPLTPEELELLRRAVTGYHHRFEKKAHDRETRRPGSRSPGQREGRRSRRSSALRITRNGSRS